MAHFCKQHLGVTMTAARERQTVICCLSGALQLPKPEGFQFPLEFKSKENDRYWGRLCAVRGSSEKLNCAHLMNLFIV